MKRLGQAAALLMVIAAGWMILSHLRMPYATETLCLTASRALPRAGERMEYRMPSGPVDINRAGAEELDALYGVGPVISQRIVDERDAGGPFHYPEDLLSVKGIGEKTLEKFRNQIRIH